MADSLRELSAAFLARRHHLQAFIQAMVGDPHVAEDVFQDVWLALADAVERGRTIERIDPWCRGVARNLVLQHWRRNRALKVITDSALLDRLESAFAESDDGAEHLADYRMALRACLEALPDGSRELLRRKYEQGDSVATLADALGKTRAAVKMSLMRIRREMERCSRRRLKLEGRA